MASARAVVGPLAPSQMILAWICSALLLVITCSSAAGTSTSHFRVSRSSLLIGSPFLYLLRNFPPPVHWRGGGAGAAPRGWGGDGPPPPSLLLLALSSP